MTRTACWLLVGVIPSLCGCASNPRLDPASPKAVLALLDERSPSGSVLAAELSPLEAGTTAYAVLDEHGNVTGQVTIARRRTTEYAAAIARSEGDARTEYWIASDDGGVQMPAVVETGENALSLFDPPLVVAFSHQPAGKALSCQSSMRVMDARHPSRERHSGTATQSITYAADQRLRIGDREFTAKRVDIHFHTDLKLATADDKTSIFVVNGEGIVAQRTVSEVRVLGAFGKTTHRTLVRDDLLSPPKTR